MKMRKRNRKWRILAFVLSVVVSLSSVPFAGTTSEAASILSTNGNGGATDVGAWFTTYNTSAFWGETGRFSDPNNVPVGFKALRADGTYGIPNSASTAEIDFQLKKMAEAGIDFILFDLTNGGLTSEFSYGMGDGLKFILDNAKLTCERIAKWNDTHDWKIRYAIGVGVYLNLRATYTGSLTGSPYREYQSVGGTLTNCATVGLTTELQVKAVKELFLDNATYGDDYYTVDGKPLLVLHETGTDDNRPIWNAYEGDKTYGNTFTVRSSNSQAQSGSYGWYTNDSNDATTHGAITNDEVMLVCPGQWNHTNSTPGASRDDGAHYGANWDAALEKKPRIVMISSLNDYMEDTQVWPTDTSACTVEEKWSDPYQYWNLTVDYIEQLRTANGDNVPSASARLGNLALDATVTTNKQVGNYDVNRLTDGTIDFTSSTANNGIAGYTDGIAYFELKLFDKVDVNQVKLCTTPHERTNLPLDIAVDVKCANGVWKRVAEMHNLASGYNGTHDLVFDFETVQDATHIRVSANKARNASGNWRLTEIEAYYNAELTADDYTGTAKDGDDTYNIAELVSDNLIAGKIATVPSYTAQNLANLTDGVVSFGTDKWALLLYGAGSSQNNVNYYEYSFDTTTSLNTVRLYRSKHETTIAPKDIVVDVKLENGDWKRVAANYNIDYAYDVVTHATDGVVQDSSLTFTFDTVECTAFRISSNRQRTRVENNSLTSTYNWRLTEIEAYYDPSVTSYTGIEAPDEEAYSIPMLTLNNLASGKTVTTNGYVTNTSHLSYLTDGTTSGSPVVYFNTAGATATNTKVIYFDIDLGSVQSFNRVDLTLFLEYWSNADKNPNGTYMKRDPRDIAIDVLDPDAKWVRVAEAHNLDYGTLKTGTKNQKNIFYFDLIEGSKIRISFNRTQVGNYLNGSTGGPLVSPCEVAAYCDYNVMESQHTGVNQATVANTEIPMYLSDNFALGGAVTTNGALNESAGPLASLTNGAVGSDRAISYFWQGGNANKTGNNIRYFDIAFEKEVLINQVVVDYFNNSDGKSHRSQDIAIDVLTADGTYVRVAERHNVTEVTTQNLQLTYSFAARKAVGIRITENNIQSASYASSGAPFLAYSEVSAYYNPNVPGTVPYTGKATATVAGSEIPLYVSKNYALNGTVTSTNTNASLASSYPVSRLTDGNKGSADGCGIINYVNGLASIEVTFEGVRNINEVRLYLSKDEQANLPHDLALSAMVNGKWQRVAELNDQVCSGSTSYLAFKFRAVSATAIKVTATNATNTNSNNFRLVEIEAYNNPNLTKADYTLYTDLTGDLLHDDADTREARAILIGNSNGAMDVNGDGKENACDLVHLKTILTR